ncbi:hypothetical protein [Algisphaera agarilytica]|uniref:Uncharacterized protein n=1 Tax=Algisphaera agarilytica TaxID=1385975 RepID=A0A7X0H914_9BACT|nr:hypothetical protein [Algisphaera agarilytica]MBB6431498.1 hypothetical protein [Algisphaera agarilytica]
MNYQPLIVASLCAKSIKLTAGTTLETHQPRLLSSKFYLILLFLFICGTGTPTCFAQLSDKEDPEYKRLIKAIEPLKYQGNFQAYHFEITEILQQHPHVPSLWSEAAFNLIYNIPSTKQSYAERWKNVKDGLQLIGQDAVTKNPESAELRTEMAWFYLHLFRHRFDEIHNYYTVRHLEEWSATLAKNELEIALVSNNISIELVGNLENHLGTLDWRHPSTHGIYWATEAFLLSNGLEVIDGNETEWLIDRMVFFHLRNLLYEGTMSISEIEKQETISVNPNPQYLEIAEKAHLAIFDAGLMSSPTVELEDFYISGIYINARFGNINDAETFRKHALQTMLEKGVSPEVTLLDGSTNQIVEYVDSSVSASNPE